MVKEQKTETNTKTIERALKILDCFSREQSRLLLSDISQMVGLSPSTAYRILSTLESHGYVKRDTDSLLYSLGYKLINLGAICLSTEEIRDIARPYLIQLRDLFNESVGLFIMSKTERVCIDRVLSTHPLHRVIDVGARMLMTRGASGKVLLAYQSEELINRLLLEDPSLSKDDLVQVRQDGYAVSFNEHGQGLASVAAPIFNSEHEVEAALFITAPMSRINEKRAQDMIDKTVEMANNISVKRGY